MKRSTALLLAVIAIGTGSVSAADKPNVLFVFADDMAYDAVHATGNDRIETPNIDRLVRRGTTFTHAYNQGGWHGAVCVASRTMLNTGRFLWHARDDEKSLKDHYQANGLMWSQLLGEAGYQTFFSGKWHVKADAEKLFDVARHVRPGMPNQTPEGYNRPLEGKPDPWDPTDPKFEGFWKGGRHWSAIVADDAVDFLGMAAKDERPFFAYLAFNAPHDPRQSPKEYVDKYPVDSIDLPEPFLAEYPHKDAIGCGPGLRDEKLAPFPRTEHAVRVNRREYYAIITHMDDQIGRILDALEKTGQAEDTVIVFTADHGLACGHHGLMGKQNMFDHSIRVPFVVAGPTIPEGKRIDTPIYLQDVMPTTLELAGAEVPEHVEFQSLLPLIRGESDRHYPAIYSAYVNVQRAVTVGDLKLIHYPKIDEWLLFDLENDPHETTNLADRPERRADVERLRSVFESLQEATGDRLALD